MNADELTKILNLHKNWLLDEPGGARADLRGANLSRANLSRADLSRANLRGANLSGADLSEAILPALDFEPIPQPELARQIADIARNTPEKFKMDAWHTCETTHCGWGWAIVLNGEKGQALENKLGIQAAGALLFPAFSQHVLDSNEDALAALDEIAAGE